MKIGASKSPVLLGLIAATAGFAGLAAVVRHAGPDAPGPLKPEFVKPHKSVHEEQTAVTKPDLLPTGINGEDVKPVVTDASVVRYVTMEGEQPTLSKEVTLKPGEDAHVRSLTETVKSLGYKDVRVLQVNVEKGAAMVDVSPTLTSEGFSSTSEAAFIESIARTLGQFAEIKTFQLRIDGQVLDTLGHLELTEATKVIRPGAGIDESETPSREPNP